MDSILDGWSTEDLEKLAFAQDRIQEFTHEHKNDPSRAREIAHLKLLLDQIKVMNEGGKPDERLLKDFINETGRYDSLRTTAQITHELLSIASATSKSERDEHFAKLSKLLELYHTSYNPRIVDATTSRPSDKLPHHFTMPSLQELLEEAADRRSYKRLMANIALANMRRSDVSRTNSNFSTLCSHVERADIMPDEALADLIAENYDNLSKNQDWTGVVPLREKLTIPQLDLVASRVSKAYEDSAFCTQYIAQLRPSPKTPLSKLPADVKEQYFQSLLTFARKLSGPTHHLKLYAFLSVLQQLSKENRYDFDLFVEFLKSFPQIPRHREPHGHTEFWNSVRSACTPRYGHLLPPLEASVVSDYLEYYIRCEPDDEKITTTFAPQMGELDLKQRIAEVRLKYNMVRSRELQASDAKHGNDADGYSIKTSVTVDSASLAQSNSEVDEFVEKYKAYLPPHQLKSLFDQSYLKWARDRDNKDVFEVEEPVVLYALAKNVKTVTVKLFRIDTESRLLSLLAEGNLTEEAATSAGTVDLSGLVPHLEGSIDLSSISPYSETCVKVSVPALVGKRGEFVIELSTEGISTRALVRKGYVPFLEQATKIGHVFGIFTEDNKPASGFIRMGRQTFHSDNKGYIVVPYAEREKNEVILITRTGKLDGVKVSTPGSPSNERRRSSAPSTLASSRQGFISNLLFGKPASMTSGFKPSFVNVEVRLEGPSTTSSEAKGLSTTSGANVEETKALDEAAEERFTTVATFKRSGVNFQFAAGFHIDKEAVLQHTMATVIIHATLTLNGHAMPLESIKDFQLIVTTQDAEQVTSTQSVPASALKFTAAGLGSHQFRVPEGLVKINFTLQGKVEHPVTATTQTIAASDEFLFNDCINIAAPSGLNLQNRTGLYLYRLANGDCQIYLLGIGGEPLPYTRVSVRLDHCVSPKTIFQELETDQYGRITIRNTQLLEQLTAHSDMVGSRVWNLIPVSLPGAVIPKTLNVERGRTVRIPYTGSASSIHQTELSFVEISDTETMRPIRSVLKSAAQLDLNARHIVIDTTSLIPGIYLLTVDALVESRSSKTIINVLEGSRLMDFILSDGLLTQVSPVGQGSLQIASVSGPGVGPLHTMTQWGKHGLLPQGSISNPGSSYYSPSAPSESKEILTPVPTGAIRIKLANVTEHTRVVAFASYFVPEVTLFEKAVRSALLIHPNLRSHAIVKPQAVFYDPQTLGSEHRYIMNRRTAPKSVGNMLPRPTLLLAKRFVRNTSLAEEPTLVQTSQLRAAPKPLEAERLSVPAPARAAARANYRQEYVDIPRSAGVSLEFLAQPAKLLWELHPNAEGIVEIDRSLLGDFHSYISIFVCNTNDPSSLVGAAFPIVPKRMPTSVAAPVPKEGQESKSESTPPERFVTAFRDYRLISSLNPDRHYTEQYLSTCLHSGETLVIQDFQSSKVEIFTSLEDVRRILFALNPSLALEMADFAFLLNWPQLTEEQKCARFNQYLSHELNLFIYFKDRPFFNKVVRPHISNKVRKTLIDSYLLDEDLSKYVASEAFASLNTLERILLGERIGPAESSAIRKLTADLTPPKNLSHYSTLFKAALRGRELDEPSDRDLKPREERAFEAMPSYQAFGAPPAPPPPAPMPSGAMFMGGAPPPPVMPMAAMSMSSVAMGAPAMKTSVERSRRAVSRSIQPQSHPLAVAPAAPAAPAAPVALADEDYEGFAESINAALPELTKPRETYRAPETTKEYEERDYYKATLAQAGHLVPCNEFWVDYAAYVEAHPRRDVPFLSSNFVYATSSMTEAIFALAVLDLPCNKQSIAAPYTIDFPINQPTWKLTAGSNCIVFHQELREAEVLASTSVSVTQNYFDPADPVTREDGENVAKLVRQFLPGRVYSCRVAVTNIAPFEQRCGILLQPPTGSIGVKNNRMSVQAGERQILVLKTRNEFVTLQPYSTTVLMYSFYFPITGHFDHYPAHVCKNTRSGVVILGYGEPRSGNNRLPVLPQLDAAAEAKSWLWIAAKSSLDDLLVFLRDENLTQFPGYQLEDIYWRCNDASAWEKIYKTLRAKRTTLPVPFLQFVFKHWEKVDPVVANEALASWFTGTSRLRAKYFHAKDLLHIDIADTWAATAYGQSISHLEYMPLLCARVHQLTVAGGRDGTKKAEIQNIQLRETYQKALRYLIARFTTLDRTSAAWLLTLSYLLLLQERIHEAENVFEIAKRKVHTEAKSADDSGQSIVSLRLQVDYMDAYFKFFRTRVPIAEVRAITEKYKSYPVQFWRTLFMEVDSQLNEIEGIGTDMIGATGRPVNVEEADMARERGDFKVDNAEIKDMEIINRARTMDALALTEPALEATVEKSTIVVTHQNLTAFKVKFFPMDIEFLFSSEPFLKQGSKKFVNVAANATISLTVPPTFGETRVDIPAKFKSTNLTIQISSETTSRVVTLTYFPCDFNVQVIEAFGQVKVTRKREGSDFPIPVPLAYVKCYARLKDGRVDFYKDGYTDHRGRFDYVSLSSDKLSQTERFALLVSSPDYGSFVCEAAKPSN